MADRHNRDGDNVAKDGSLPILTRLGERVRTIRSGRGMSRKVLARQARVSERHLAQLEAGTGNISIVLLSRIARAMSVPLSELVDERPPAPAQAAPVEDLLARLAPPERVQAYELLAARFGGSRGRKRAERIALIGLRGGGKSTLGRLLAQRLGLPFIELDREIEATSGIGLAEMFEMFGQETFRHNERLALEAVLGRHESFVLATGGSLVSERATFELLLWSCLTVWVRTDPKAHMARVVAQGDLRPIADSARAMDDLLSILKSREPLYARADLTLDTAGRTPQESLLELAGLLEESAMRDASDQGARRE